MVRIRVNDRIRVGMIFRVRVFSICQYSGRKKAESFPYPVLMKDFLLSFHSDPNPISEGLRKVNTSNINIFNCLIILINSTKINSPNIYQVVILSVEK